MFVLRRAPYFSVATRGAVALLVAFVISNGAPHAHAERSTLRIARTPVRARGENIASALEVYGPDRQIVGAVYLPPGVRWPRSAIPSLSIVLTEEHIALSNRVRAQFPELTSGGRWLIRWFPRVERPGVPTSIRFQAAWVRGGQREWRQWTRRTSEPLGDQSCAQLVGEDELATAGVERLDPLCVR